MKKTTSLLIVLFTLACFVNAQQSKLVGSWLMTKAIVDGKIEQPYFITEFKDDGKFIVMGIDFGTWEYNSKKNSIILNSELDKDWNGERKIETVNEKELVITKNDTKLFYKKVDMVEVTEANKNSGLMGIWEFKDVPYSEVLTLLTFSEPDEFKIIQKELGSTSNLSGTWIFDKENSMLIMIGLRGEDTFKGENKIIKLDEKNLELENNSKIYKGQRKEQNTTKIERLLFQESDFYNADGNYKYYEDERKLPWFNWDDIKNNLLDVKQLVYKYSKLINGTEVFEDKILRADVKAKLEDEGFTIDNIFVGYDRYNLPEETEFQDNEEFSKSLYPLTDDVFRVVGNEKITTAAGTFNCAVVEVVINTDVLKKLWVITDNRGLGIYAKIIEDDPDKTFGHYVVYELQKID